jgi:hypothetical protein
MFTMIKALFGKLRLPAHLREALSEDGVGSYSRYAGAFSVVIAAVWVSYVVFKTHALPDLGGAATWVATGNSAYAAGQAKRVAAAIKGNPAPNMNPNKGDSSVDQ